VLERLVQEQLVQHISAVYPLSNSQHGFICGRSTTTNLLSCDAVIADYVNRNEPYDVISFDFQNAFDKVPHQMLLTVLEKLKLHEKTSKWFASFLSGRFQRVAIGNMLSRPAEVTSGVVQGSVLGLTLFCVYIDLLLKQLDELNLPLSSAYADDIKFVTGVNDCEYHIAQKGVDTIATWSSTQMMPLSIDKNMVLHCGSKNPKHRYILGGHLMSSVKQFEDLGVLRSEITPYADHIVQTSAEYARMSGLVRRTFRSCDRNLLWSAFQTYIKPKLMYASVAWSPLLKYEVNNIENVQRRFTKRLPGFSDLSYEDRLLELNAIKLEHSRIAADIVFIYKEMRNCNLNNYGLTLSGNNHRSGRVRLEQPNPHANRARTFFKYRAPGEWNQLPANVTSSLTVTALKCALHKHFKALHK
jgi:hypothetical protein